jgi:TRAP-type C4-dicarboxylate transport system permease small subunit
LNTNGFWSGLLARLIGSEIDASVALCKIHAALAYLKLVKGVRSLALLLCVLVLCVVVFACGFLIIPVALCLFMPWAAHTKAIVAVSFGAAYLIVPLIVAMALFSQKRWKKIFKADTLLKEALKQRGE